MTLPSFHGAAIPIAWVPGPTHWLSRMESGEQATIPNRHPNFVDLELQKGKTSQNMKCPLIPSRAQLGSSVLPVLG